MLASYNHLALALTSTCLKEIDDVHRRPQKPLDEWSRPGTQILTSEEAVEGRQFLAQRGWTLEQGTQLANGVFFIESVLIYRQRRD